MEADLENVMSVLSAACVKFQRWGKLLGLNVRCFVVNALSVAISHRFSEIWRVMWQFIGKHGIKRVRIGLILNTTWYQKRRIVSRLINMCIICFFIIFWLFCCIFCFGTIYALLVRLWTEKIWLCKLGCWLIGNQATFTTIIPPPP